MAFHAQDGLHFERILNGGVRVFCRSPHIDSDGQRPETMSVELTASEWASVMTSVSCRGSETSRLHQEALDFHERIE